MYKNKEVSDKIIKVVKYWECDNPNCLVTKCMTELAQDETRCIKSMSYRRDGGKPHRYPKIRKPYRYRPRILLKTPPFTEDGALRLTGLGIVIGEGFSYCRPSDRRLLIGVSSCDKKAVEMVAKSWGTSVWRLKQRRCEITPENPEEYPYVTEPN